METESFKLDVLVTVTPETPSGLLSNVVISQEREFEQFLINKNNDTVTSLGSYPDRSSRYNPLIYLKLQNFEPEYVYQLLHSQLQDHVLSEHIADQIVVKAQQQRSQSLDLPQEPLFLVLSVTLTQKKYIFMPCNSAPSTTDLDQEDEDESKTCAICLENLSRSKDYYQMPNCSHCFHGDCVAEWLIRRHNSCPLCRKPVWNNKIETESN